MFTGIIEGVGRIESLERSAGAARLRVNLANARQIGRGLRLGDSIAVNGCCLTVVEFSRKILAADLSGETLRRTSFGERRIGDAVNLERPLTAQARLNGHFVQGHVDGMGRVVRLAREGENWWLAVRVPQESRRYVVRKGSLAVDGISLTVAGWRDGVAEMAIIPFTYERTNVQAMLPGDAVNLETDILAKYVESLLESRGTPAVSRLTVGRLIEEGF
ncbi:MAG TPA: riboflavin synthase [Candidatus Cybelea sp.]|nr:riboflavin synthase [Candidatus Cybelea sp.]